MDVLVELFKEAEIVAVILIPVVSGIVEVLKGAFAIKERYLPLLALVTGIVLNATFAMLADAPMINAILVGAIGGLGASGLYDNLQVGKLDGK